MTAGPAAARHARIAAPMPVAARPRRTVAR